MLTGRLVVALVFFLIAGTASALHPLEPLDTSSSRATMASFLALTEETTRHYTEYRDSPSAAAQDALWQSGARASRLLELSQVPPAARQEVGFETFLLLWEVIARLELPDLTEIPDASAYREGDETAQRAARWRIPGTEIIIARVEEGPRAGEFLFSPDTVEQARRFYDRARDLPYQRPVPIENLSRTEQLLTGWMIPMVWVEALPDWANTPVLGQVLWKWFALLLLFGLALGPAQALGWVPAFLPAPSQRAPGHPRPRAAPRVSYPAPGQRVGLCGSRAGLPRRGCLSRSGGLGRVAHREPDCPGDHLLATD